MPTTQAYSLGIGGIGDSLSIGEVKFVNPSTFTAYVYIQAGHRKGLTVEAIIRSPAKNDGTKTGAIFMPDFSDLVYVDWRYGPTPMITEHVSSLYQAETGTDFKTQVGSVRTFGGEDKYHSGVGNKNYRWGPTDIMPGDKVISSRGGALLGVLAGGVAKLCAAPLAQIVLCKLNDLVRIVSRNFELFSDFGIMRMRNSDGVTSFELLGNAAGKKTNAHHESNWDYIFRIGGTDLFDLSLKNLFRLRVDTDGAAFIKAAAASIDLQAPPQIKIRGDAVHGVDGHRSTIIGGDDWKKVSGTKTEKLGRHAYVNSGARNELVGGSHQGSYLGTHKETVRGTSITSVDTVGKETRVAAGDYNIAIGNPLDLGVPAPLLLDQAKTGDFSVATFSGDVSFQARVKGSFSFETLIGDVDLSTEIGKVNLSTALGDLSFSTDIGGIDLSTLAGNIKASTLFGEIDLESTIGDVKITATAGSITLTAGASSLVLGPAGISIKNAGLDLMTLMNQTLTQLGTATLTPGFGAPIANAAAFVALQAQWLLLTGAPA